MSAYKGWQPIDSAKLSDGTWYLMRFDDGSYGGPIAYADLRETISEGRLPKHMRKR